jgi:hypothetical protein
MFIKDVINAHTGKIFFYPFSGSDFDIVKANFVCDILSKTELYVFCTIQNEEELFKLEYWKQCGNLGRLVLNTENAIGLAGLVTTASPITLEDTAFESSYHVAGSRKFIFVKGEVFQFVEYLQGLNIEILRFNIILKNAGGAFDHLIPLLDLFHGQMDTPLNIFKYIVVHSRGYLIEILKHYKEKNIYQVVHYLNEENKFQLLEAEESVGPDMNDTVFLVFYDKRSEGNFNLSTSIKGGLV